MVRPDRVGGAPAWRGDEGSERLRKRKFELRAGWSTQSQAADPQNPLEVREQHLNFLAISPGPLVGRRLGDRAGDIARCLVHVACDLPARRVWTAFGLQRADAAIGDAREIRDSVISAWSACST